MLVKLSERVFLKILMSIIMVVIFVMGIFNWFEDPYEFFQPPVVRGFNHWPVVARSSRIKKPYGVTKDNYDALIMGSSRAAALGSHPSWQGYNMYNMHINAGTIYEMYRNIQHAHAHHPLKRLIIGLDIMSFSAAWKYKGQYDENRLLVTEKFARSEPLLRWKIYFRDICGLLGAKKVTELSFEKMLTSIENRHIDEKIFSTSTKHKNRHVSNKTDRDYHLAALKTEIGFLSKGGNWLNSYKNLFGTYNPVSQYNSMETYEKLVQFCYSNDIEMKVYFSPIHARLLLGMYYVGLWDELETFKTEVFQVNRTLAAKFNKAPFDIWDFTTINSYTKESIPPLGEKMQYYQEVSHYSPVLADKLQTVITGFGDRKDIAEDFGVLLSSLKEDHLDQYYREQLDKLKSYVREHQKDASEIYSTAKRLGTLQHKALSDLQDTDKIGLILQPGS